MTRRLADLANDPEVIDDLVYEATTDWLGFFVLHGILKRALGWRMSLTEFADAAMPVLRTLLTEHGVVPGDLVPGPDGSPRFVPWQTGTQESLARIEAEMRALDHEPLSDEICWFSREP